MSQRYLYSLTENGGGSAYDDTEIKESIEEINTRLDNIINENLILHSKAMDFPDWLTLLDERGYDYEVVTTSEFNSNKALQIAIPTGQSFNWDILIEDYLKNINTSTVEQYFTLSFYIRSDFFNMLNLNININHFNLISIESEDISSVLRRYIIKLVLPPGVTISNTTLTLAGNIVNYVDAILLFSSIKLERGNTVTQWIPTEESGGLINTITKTGEQILYIEPTGASLSDLVIITAYPDCPELSKTELLHMAESVGMLIPISMGSMAVNAIYNVNGSGVAIAEDNLTDGQRTYESSVMIIGNGYTYSIE